MRCSQVNPVTGKMERVDPASAADGKHTDGSLRIDDRYVNAAKELGLGGADGMYSHIKSLGRVAGGVADIPVGTSIESAAAEKARAEAPRPVATVDVRNTDAAMSAIRTTVTTVGRARVAGFASGVRSSSAHNHADAFQRRKGVVNTVSGAKDITRVTAADPPRLPPKGSRPTGPRIMSMSTMEASTEEGRHRAEGREKRERAEAKMGSGGRHDLGGNPVAGGGGGGPRHASAAPTSARSAPSSHGGGGGAHRAAVSGGGSGVSHHASSGAGPSHVLGGGKPPASGGAVTAAAIAERRAAHFEAKFAEEQARKAVAAKKFLEKD